MKNKEPFLGLISREINFIAHHSHHGMLSEPSHSHEYIVRLTFQGEANEEGFVCDFRAVKRLFRKLVSKHLEESDLDEYFEYPTSENLSVWIWERIAPFFPLYSIEIREKPHSSVVYFGPKA